MADFTIYEVGPRDGLQTIQTLVSTKTKLKLINALRQAGLRSIETVSFAHPLYVPQMADAEDVYDGEGAALVMNRRGMDRALKVGVEKFNIVFSPSNEFNLRNLGCELGEAIERYRLMLVGIPKENIRVYLSCFFGCPYEGKMSLHKLKRVIEYANELGNTVVFADTVGVAELPDIKVAAALSHRYGVRGALHLHVQRGRLSQALSMVGRAIELGITEIDSSIGGLGGCPFVEGSPGNLPTGELVKWAAAQGLDCGVSIDDLVDAEAIAAGIAEPFSPATLSA